MKTCNQSDISKEIILELLRNIVTDFMCCLVDRSVAAKYAKYTRVLKADMDPIEFHLDQFKDVVMSFYSWVPGSLKCIIDYVKGCPDVSSEEALESVNRLIDDTSGSLESSKLRYLKYERMPGHIFITMEARIDMVTTAINFVPLYENLVCVRKYIMEQS